jgi:hypothetical protein
MNALLKLSILAVVLAVAPNLCLAEREIRTVLASEAKEMGVELRATPAGPDAVWLELGFKTEGKLKGYSPERSFSRVELDVRDGKKPLLGYAVLQEQHPKPGHVLVRFMANRAYLDKVILTIVIGDGLLPGGAYELRVKELLDAPTTR